MNKTLLISALGMLCPVAFLGALSALVFIACLAVQLKLGIAEHAARYGGDD